MLTLDGESVASSVSSDEEDEGLPRHVTNVTFTKSTADDDVIGGGDAPLLKNKKTGSVIEHVPGYFRFHCFIKNISVSIDDL